MKSPTLQPSDWVNEGETLEFEHNTTSYDELCLLARHHPGSSKYMGQSLTIAIASDQRIFVDN